MKLTRPGTVLAANCLAFVICAISPIASSAQDPTTQPLLQIGDLQFEGAFRLPADQFGASSLNFSEGPMVVDGIRQSLFIVGHAHHQAVAEFSIPQLVNSSTLSDLNMASSPMQNFSTILDLTPDNNPQALDRIGGLALISNGSESSLFVNAYEYYDAPADNTLTTMRIDVPGTLSASPAAGYFLFEGGAGHTSGWISPIPTEWQALLGGDYLTGQSSGIPIISRTSVGPSAFSFASNDLFPAGAGDMVPTNKLLDFSLSDPLHAELDNASLTNTLWTHLSRVVYGVIVPGTRTYLTVGSTGGHSSGVCYKCTQSDGNLCGGYCAPDHTDYTQQYWLWDVNDLLAVRNGTVSSSDVRPYAHGPFNTPFESGEHQIGGASFDAESGLLYIAISRADNGQGEYSNPPVIEAWSVAESIVRNEGSGIDSPIISIDVFPNPVASMARVRIETGEASGNGLVSLVDLLGRTVEVVFDGTFRSGMSQEFTVDVSKLSNGFYTLRVEGAWGSMNHALIVAR